MSGCASPQAAYGGDFPIEGGRGEVMIEGNIAFETNACSTNVAFIGGDALGRANAFGIEVHCASSAGAFTAVASFPSPGLDSRTLAEGFEQKGSAVLYWKPPPTGGPQFVCATDTSFLLLVLKRSGGPAAEPPTVTQDFNIQLRLTFDIVPPMSPYECPFDSSEIQFDLKQSAADFHPAKPSDPPS